MNIKRIKLKSFRNYEDQEIQLGKNINIFYGNNAQGKTNIIESIFLCAYGKSFRAKRDKELIQFNKEYATVEIDYEKVDRQGNIRVNLDQKKVFFLNDIKQDKISKIVGKINIVTFTPDDINIIKGDPEKRRRFLDMMISSLRPNYIYLLNRYKNILEERNNYLKQIKIQGKKEELLELWDEQLSEYSAQIYEYRKVFIEKLQKKAQVIHNSITKSGKEEIKIKYLNNGKNKEEFLKNLINNRKKDILRGYTSTGIHREDLLIYINGNVVGNFGSQGQQRTSILTLKLCELEIVKEEINETPILLLDDYMSELDEIRRKSFLENIKDCQVILTCTEDMEIYNTCKRFNVNNGKCYAIDEV